MHLDGAGQNYAQRIVRSAEWMDALLLDLLAYGRVARAEVAFASVSVQAAWEAALAQNEETIREMKARIEVLSPLPRVRAHESTLGQALANLLSDALKFVAPHVTPQVRLWAEERPHTFRLWIEDNVQ